MIFILYSMMNTTKILNNAEERILELWTRKGELLLNLLQNQMQMTEKFILHVLLILMDDTNNQSLWSSLSYIRLDYVNFVF